MNLKAFFRNSTQRVSFTTDTWTSVQRINYMCITAHFIDSDWKLHKKIISFIPVASHKGENLSKALEGCLLDWGVKNIFTVTVDNAASNDTAMIFFRNKLISWGESSVRLKYMHMRCIAHILNLVVQDGMRLAEKSLKNIREAYKFVRSSPARLIKFRQICDLVNCQETCALCLDVQTRWNSTYLMLSSALKYRRVFEQLEGNNTYRSDMKNDIPTFGDWQFAECFVKLLKSFYDMTLRISGSLYETSNIFFTEVYDLNCILDDMVDSPNDIEKTIGTKMKEKFLKYWGNEFEKLYGEERGKVYFDKVKSSLTELVDEYTTTSVQSTSTPSQIFTQTVPSVTESSSLGKPQSRIKNMLKRQRMESGVSMNKQSELQTYLSESLVDESDDFDILRWWKVNSDRFPNLSKFARDVLAVPISTVASESCFSTSGRVLYSFRSSLTPKIVEALVCTQDWLRHPHEPILVEENLDEVEKMEKEMISGLGSLRLKEGSSFPSIPEDELYEFMDLGS